MRYTLTLAIIILVSWSGNSFAQTAAADSLMSLGDDKFSDSNYTEAAELRKEAMRLYLQERDSLKWAMAKEDYASTLVALGAVQEGLRVLLELDEVQIQGLTNEDKAAIKKAIGYAYRNLEKYDAAKNYYLEGLELLKGSRDSLDIASLHNNISYTFSETGNYEQALQYQHQARRIFETMNEKRKLSRVLNGIFLSLMDLGMYNQAEPYIRKSLDLCEQLGEPRLLDIAYHNLAWNFENQGKRDSSIIYYQKSLEISRQLKNPFDITQTLNNIGSLYERSGDYESALAYYNDALEANYQTERPVSIANNLLRLARVAIQNNDLDNATAFYEEALERLHQTNAPRTLTNLYLHLANLNIHKEKYQHAEQYLAEAEAISRAHNFNNSQILSHSLRGRIYKTEEKRLESLREYRKAYALSAGETVTGKISPTMNLARAYRHVRSDSAFIIAEEAFNLIDSVRTNVAGLAFRSGFFRKHAGFYNEVASWYITQKNDPEKAFGLMEAAKARVLMDELAESQENIYASLDESTLIKKQQKAKKIDQLYRQLETARPGEETASIRQALKDAEFEYQSFLNEIQAGNKELRDFQYPEPIKLQQVQEILNPETALLEYTFTDQGLVQLVITHNNIYATYTDSIQQSGSRTFYTDKVRSFRDAITQRKSLNEINAQGAALYQQLLSAVLQNESISNLVIVPDGPLSYLPFEALQTKKSYLIENYTVKYLPSASIYLFIEAPHRLTNNDLLALAGSGFESEQNAASSSSSQASFASLPSTLLEVDAIAKNFALSKVLKNEDVTEANLKSHDLSHFRFIHFATHANVDEVNPSRSGLLLSKKMEVETLFGEDGHLNSREISNLRLNADLVTLSACNTGMGKLVTGEGLIGLQRSFLSAGASAVMVSLWSVFDKSTSVFMDSFYDHLLTHEAEEYNLWSQTLEWFGFYKHPLIDYKTKAIRDAKLTLIDHPYYNHPVHWAPFILIGK